MEPCESKFFFKLDNSLREDSLLGSQCSNFGGVGRHELVPLSERYDNLACSSIAMSVSVGSASYGHVRHSGLVSEIINPDILRGIYGMDIRVPEIDGRSVSLFYE